MRNLDLNIKSPLIKYTDDTGADSVIDNDAELTQSNRGSLVSTTHAISYCFDILICKFYIWKTAVYNCRGEDSILENSNFEKFL